MPHPPALPATALRLVVYFLLTLAAAASLLKVLWFPAWPWWCVTAALWLPWAICSCLGLWVVLSVAFRTQRA